MAAARCDLRTSHADFDATSMLPLAVPQCRGAGAPATCPWRILLQLHQCSAHLCVLQGAVYIGSGYLALPDVFKYGALFSVINLTLWSVVGVFWWKALGLY
jgi:di/tricarboxylate transporter